VTAPVADVIILNWNGRDDTLAALAEVTRQAALRAPGEITVTVVDNGSTDGTAEVVASRFPTVRLLRSAVNRGFTGGIRLGALASEAQHLVLLNNDAVPEEGWLDALVDSIASADDDVIALAGRIVDPGGTKGDFLRGVMTFDGHGFQPGFRRPLEEIEEPRAGAEFFFACGGNMIVRREPFLELGGFDDDYFAYLEDVDFGWRAWAAGWRIVWAPAATVRHKSSATSERVGAFERGVLFERNAFLTVIRNYDADALRQTDGQIFLTLLHRLHTYVVTRNAAGAATRPPLGAPQPEPRPSWLRRLFRRRDRIVIDDPLTIMQLRALTWIFRNGERIAARRREVQSRRVRSDAEIFSRFPLYYVPTYPGDEELMRSALFRLLGPDFESVATELDAIMQR
jgi:GT2 family glycosyltransferase